MRLHRFYISEKIGSQIQLTIASAELINQISRVFRLGKNDRVVFFDGSLNDYECEIVSLKKDLLIVKILNSTLSRYVPSRNIYLYQSLIKKDNFEWIVEKATELGVTHIIPVIAEHSEKKSLNEERLKKIAIEASEQSGRGNVPVISSIISLEKAISSNFFPEEKSGEVRRYFFHTEGKISSKPRFGENSKDGVAIFIGPEGGWSENEIEMFHKHKIEMYCLGGQVLRSETAAIIALSQAVD